ncbi:YbaN family protein [Qipengyuania huizhouensis]|uniref:YbaN family protein n=1 Tax=Qipengyuania huizhouensis TaxID=2867245 RepID=UPI0017F130D2|nr:YbaN family protein [Qipengyuania huizhouensis]MBA4765824.1 YbaN family protein [Erythrobacter sp.]MBX7460786.1 YbaN family protein [Qipengyuania huizhouensis]
MRALYRVLGYLAVALGAIGAFLPIMPTVPFLLLAVYFFARSSPELEKRILDHPHWGPQVKDWRERRAISRRAKTMAIGAMATGAVFTWYTLGAPYYWISIAILVIAGSWIATRNE